MYPGFIERFVTNPSNFGFLGFIIVRKVINEKEVSLFRELIKENFEKSNDADRILFPSQVLEIPELYEIIFREKSVMALQSVLGESYTQFCDFNLRKNCFGGWHVDSGSEKGADYLFKKDYKFVKCGIFFQKNSKEYGGGVDFRLFSHKFLYNRFPKILKPIISRFYNIIKSFLSHKVIIHPGDLVFFDSRLEHTSSLPSSVRLSDLGEKGIVPLDELNSKYVLYWNACSNKFSKEFMKNTFNRAIFEEVLPGTKEVFFTDYASRIYPDEYPKSFISLVDKYKIKIASPSKREALVFKKLLDLVS